jgi:hypothetical protein
MKDFETWFGPIALVVSTLAALVTVVFSNRSQKREITFTGEPVDKQDFEKALRDNKEDHDKLFSLVGGIEREVENRLNHALDRIHHRLNPMEGEICALREASETNTARLVQMDAKIDRLIERTK